MSKFVSQADYWKDRAERAEAKLSAPPEPSEDGFVTVTTTEDGRCVMVSRQDEDHRILKVLWEAKDVPTEPVTIDFGKRGKNMFFKIGNQSFCWITSLKSRPNLTS